MNTVQSVVSTSRWIDRIGFLNDLFCGRSYIAAPAELSIPFLLDEKSTVVPQGILSIWIGNHRDIAIFWTFSHAWGNEKLINFRRGIAVWSKLDSKCSTVT